MMVDGGLVHKVFKFPKRPGKADSLVIRGVWTGGTWSPNTQFMLQQYRKQQFISSWKVVGVDLITRPTIDTALIVQLDRHSPSFEQDDILVFGNGTCTIFAVKGADLPLTCTSAVQVGSPQYHAIAKVDKQLGVTQFIVFHAPDVILSSQDIQVVWWNNREYPIAIAPLIDEAFNHSRMVTFA